MTARPAGTAGDLPYGLSPAALDAASAEPDPSSVAAASRLRARFPPPVAAAALQQVALRRRARVKFGPAAERMFFTRAGLEQATRPEVADHHAARFAAAGVRRVVDLGCGIGADAAAFARAGLEVLAVERDPDTAAVARANLPATVEVRVADAAELAAQLGPGEAVFCDPARRDDAGRVWRVTDFSPGWDLVSSLLTGDRVAGVKLGPALPHALVPDGVEAEWVSHRGDVVEVALWAGGGAVPGRRSALVWPGSLLVVDAPAPALTVRPVGRFVHEPDGAVIRAGGIPELGRRLGAGLLDPHLAYLTGDQEQGTPFAATFAVREVLPYDLKVLRRWVRTSGIGTLEILRRGLSVDPAELRRRLPLRGPAAATLVLSRTPAGARAIVADRLVLGTPKP